MKWISTDIDMYIKAKEYVDTILIPLIPITLKKDVKSAVEMGEYITIMSTELEREFKGRLLALPAFTYLKEENAAQLKDRLNNWYANMNEEEVKHILLITADPDWKLQEKELEATLLLVPSIPLDEIDQKYMEQLVKSQMKQLKTIVMNLWQKED